MHNLTAHVPNTVRSLPGVFPSHSNYLNKHIQYFELSSDLLQENKALAPPMFQVFRKQNHRLRKIDDVVHTAEPTG